MDQASGQEMRRSVLAEAERERWSGYVNDPNRLLRASDAVLVENEAAFMAKYGSSSSFVCGGAETQEFAELMRELRGVHDALVSDGKDPFESMNDAVDELWRALDNCAYRSEHPAEYTRLTNVYVAALMDKVCTE